MKKTTRKVIWRAPAVLAALSGIVWLAGGALSGVASAQASSERVLILENVAGEVSENLRTRADETLRAALEGRSGFVFERSEVPLEDIVMAAGCSAEEEACRQEIAATVDAPWLLVRELLPSGANAAELLLSVHRRGNPAAAKRAQAVLWLEGPAAPERIVPSLVNEVLPASAPARPAAVAEAQVAPAEPAEVAAQRDDDPAAEAEQVVLAESELSEGSRALPILRAGGWVLTVVGGSLLAAGITLGGISRNDHDEYADLNIMTDGDVDRALRLLDSAQTRARRGNVLMGAGAATLVVGLTVAITSMVRMSSQREQRVAWGVLPTRDGAAFSLAGNWDGPR